MKLTCLAILEMALGMLNEANFTMVKLDSNTRKNPKLLFLLCLLNPLCMSPMIPMIKRRKCELDASRKKYSKPNHTFILQNMAMLAYTGLLQRSLAMVFTLFLVMMKKGKI